MRTRTSSAATNGNARVGEDMSGKDPAAIKTIPKIMARTRVAEVVFFPACASKMSFSTRGKSGHKKKKVSVVEGVKRTHTKRPIPCSRMSAGQSKPNSTCSTNHDRIDPTAMEIQTRGKKGPGYVKLIHK